jgi:hypothetical protein
MTAVIQTLNWCNLTRLDVLSHHYRYRVMSPRMWCHTTGWVGHISKDCIAFTFWDKQSKHCNPEDLNLYITLPGAELLPNTGICGSHSNDYTLLPSGCDKMQSGRSVLVNWIDNYLLWYWREVVPVKHSYTSTKLQSMTSHMTAIFTVMFNPLMTKHICFI